MTYAQRFSALASAALLAVAVAGCASGGNDPATSPSATPSSPAPTTAISTTAPPSESDVASTAASALVKKYYETLDAVRQDPNVPLDKLSSVATSLELSSLMALVRGEREKAQRQTGSTEISELKVQAVNTDNSEPAAGQVPTVQVDVCWDVSKVDVLDASGKSIVTASRPDRGWTRLTVANYHYGNDPRGGWRVATSEDLKKASCAAS